jgi:hypothetical protein
LSIPAAAFEDMTKFPAIGIQKLVESYTYIRIAEKTNRKASDVRKEIEQFCADQTLKMYAESDENKKKAAEEEETQ